MPRLAFISDADFEVAAERLVTRIANAEDDNRERVDKNVRDPFTLLALAAALDADRADLDRMDSARSLIQAASAAVGAFHQEVLGGMPGWENHDGLVDLVNQDRRLAAEVKNKHNTMNADTRRQVIANLESFHRSRKWGATGRTYLVAILPKAPGAEPKQLAERVWEVDGRRFYGLASGEEDAMDQVFVALTDRLGELATPGRVAPDVVSFCLQLFDRVHKPAE